MTDIDESVIGSPVVKSIKHNYNISIIWSVWPGNYIKNDQYTLKEHSAHMYNKF